MGIQINGNTNNINAGIGSLSIEDINELDIVGVATAANFKTGTTNVHSAGIEIAGINILGADTPIGVGATIFNSGGAIFAGTSGVVTATAFHGSGANLTGIDTDLVSDTSPQLGGNLDTNSHNIFLDDDHKVIFGNDQSADLHIFHESSSGTGNIYNATGELRIRTNDLRLKNLGNSETYLKAVNNGAVELYHDNIKSLETIAEGIEIKKTASNANAFINLESSGGGQARINLITSSGNNRASRIDFHNQDVQQWTIINDYNQNGTNDFSIRHGAEEAIRALPDGAVEIYHDDGKKLETTSTGAKITGNLSFNSAGQGIDFSASAHASGQQSELLDDYERGSWTPQFFNARTGGTQLTNPSNTQAHYVKVGRIVYLHLGVHGLTKNWAGSNTQIFIRGLPYRSYFQHNGHCIRCGYFGPTGVTYSTFANLRQYDTYMELQKSGGAQGRYDALYWSDIHWEGYGNVTCEMVYETDQGV